MIEINNRSSAINRLTALWALSEAGLGGIMHALKIPFTGFFVGGFAVILISIIAFYSECSFKKIMQATLLVLLVKAGASPHSPFTAYIAVSFQGLIGAAIFHLLNHNRFSCVLFGALALLESAIQKLLVTTLIFGKSIWQAIDIFMESVLKDFHITSNYSYSEIIIFIYVIAYLILGVYLGFLSASLPKNVLNKRNFILEKFNQLPETSQKFKVKSNSRKYKWLNYFILLGFLVVSFLLADQFSKAVYVFLRSVTIILFVFLVVHPLIILLLNYFSKKRKGQLEILTNQIDEIKQIIYPAYQISSQEKGLFKRIHSFILSLIILSLYGLKDDH